MASSSSKPTSQCHIRSISLPCRSHPTSLQIEEELNKLRSWESSAASSAAAETICNGLSGLGELYKCIDDLLNLPQIIQALSQTHHDQKWVDDLLDRSMRILDVCGITKENVSQLKENIRDLQSSLRRRKGDSTIETSINNYISFRKQMKKNAKRSIAALKQIDQEIGAILDVDQSVSAVIRVLREVNSITISIFQTVLLFLSSQSSNPKPNKWSLVSRMMTKGRVGSEDQKDISNELESIDADLRSLCRNDQNEIEKVQLMQKRLESLEASIDGVAIELEGMFRCLIRSRTSLLNLLSC